MQRLAKLVGIVVAAILVWLLLFLLTGCAGTGIERKTSLLPDEFWLSSEINPQEDDWTPGPKWKVGFKWKFK